MAQNITLMGASYSAVPGVELPKTGGGTALFTDVTDTTAAAADVATGKYFYTAAGVRTQGTNSGGGGGATNFVQGTFTTSSDAGTYSFTIPYTGTGYPIMAYIVVDGGAYKSGTDWYTSTQRYAIGVWAMSKSVWSSSPTYTTSGTQNQAVTMSIYKNSTSSSTSYTRTSAMNTNTFSSSNATNAAATSVRFKTGNVLSYYVNTSSYGLHPNTTYHYFIVYSS